MPDDVTQPNPSGDTQPAVEPGAETPQVTPAPADVQPATDGALRPAPEATPTAPKTYTQEEYGAAMAERDRREAQYRQGLAQLAMREQVSQAQVAEARAQSADAQAVERGDITQEQAQQRSQQRFQGWQQGQQARQQTQAMQQQMAVAQTVLQRGEQVGRLLAAQDLAAEHGVDAKELLDDKSLGTYEAMQAKALKLALRASKANRETFDSGHMGGTRTNFDDLSPMEKVMEGLKQKR